MADERITQKVVEITLADDKTYKIRPLTLASAKKAAPIISKLQSLPDSKNLLDSDIFDSSIKVAHLVLKRTNPNLTEDQVAELIDMSNLKEIFAIGFGA